MTFSPYRITQMEADGSSLSVVPGYPESPARRLAGQGCWHGQRPAVPAPQAGGDAVGVELDLQWLWVGGAEHFTEVAQQPEPGGVGGGMELAGILLLQSAQLLH